MADFNITFDKDGNVLEGNVAFSWTFGTCQGKKNVTYSSTEPSWLTVEAYQGRNDAILITTKPTTQVGDRNGDVIIKLNGSGCTTIAVTQNGTGCECTTAFVPVAIGGNIPVGGGNNITLGNYTYSADCITISPNGSSNANWIRDIRVSNGTIIGNVEGNPNKGLRGPATITVSGQMKSDSSWCTPSLQVSQDGTGCECNPNTFGITTTSPIQIGADGGALSFSYRSDENCITSVTNPTITYTPSSVSDWITNLALAANKTVTGTVISNGATDQRSATITIKGVMKDSSKCSAEITVQQAGVNKCKCEDIEISFIKLSNEGYETETTIGTWNKKSTSTCSSEVVPIFTSSELPQITAYDNGEIKIASLPENENFGDKTFTVSISYNNGDCGEKPITQEGQVPCDCGHADFFIKVLKTSFSFDGTSPRTLVGSGQTSCGYIELKTNSDMLENRELTIEPLGDGKFNILAHVLPSNETRSTGIISYLYDELGQLIGECNSKWVLTQSNSACDCWLTNNYDIFRYDEVQIRYDDKYWCDTKKNGTSRFSPHIRAINIDCVAAYVEYDETLWDSNRNNNNHWVHRSLRPSDIILQAKEGIADQGIIETTITITGYVDVVFDDEGNFVMGFPCSSNVYKVVIWDGSCRCEVECGYEPHQQLYDEVNSDGGSIDHTSIKFCDDSVTFEYELHFEEGVEEWATIEPSEDKQSWTVTYQENRTSKERTVTIIEKIFVNGENCNCYREWYIIQSGKDCIDCESEMAKAGALNRTIKSCQNEERDIEPGWYNGSCGNYVYEITGATPESASAHITVGPAPSLNITNIPLDLSEDWVFNYRAFIANYDPLTRTYTPVFENCYKEATITVPKCNQECSCENRTTELSFTPNPNLEESYPSNYGELVIGTVGEIADGDDCLKYRVVSTQPSYVEAMEIGYDRIVKVKIKDIDKTAVNISLSIKLYNTTNGQECEGLSDAVNFTITKT